MQSGGDASSCSKYDRIASTIIDPVDDVLPVQLQLSVFRVRDSSGKPTARNVRGLAAESPAPRAFNAGTRPPFAKPKEAGLIQIQIGPQPMHPAFPAIPAFLVPAKG